jgi:MATE family multidrug resistance protein
MGASLLMYVLSLMMLLIGIVLIMVIGWLDDVVLFGGVVMVLVIFDCLFWLFVFL